MTAGSASQVGSRISFDEILKTRVPETQINLTAGLH